MFIDGLDVFDNPPRDVVRLVESLTSPPSGGIKVCIASRPWVEFDDTYRDVPKLQMYILTTEESSWKGFAAVGNLPT